MAAPILARSDSFITRASVTIGCCFALAACTAETTTLSTAKLEPTLALAPSPAAPLEQTVAPAPGQPADTAAEPVPVAAARYHVGRPYEIAGKWYEPQEDPGYDQQGVASWYGPTFHGRLTANGEVFDRAALSAAHPTLPLPSYVRVTNLENDRSIIVRVNDRGPFARDRLIDVSERTAGLLGFRRDGTTRVRVQYVEKARLDGDDETFLLASYRGPDEQPSEVMLAAAETPEPVARPAPQAPVMLASAAPDRPAEIAAERPPAASASVDGVIAFAAREPATSAANPAAEAAQILAADPPADQRIALAFELLADIDQ